VATALTGVVASGCADEAAAARVGDATISNDDVMTQVKALYGNNQLWQALDQQNGQQPGSSRSQLRGDAPGSYSQSFVANVLQEQITFALVDQLFDDEDNEVSDAHLQAAEQAQQQQYGEFFAEFPEDYQDDQIDHYSRLISLQDSLGEDGFSEALDSLIDETDIEVSSRYGSWDAQAFKDSPQQLAVVPPPGPASAPAAPPAAPGN
jgi:hypothetical protein